MENLHGAAKKPHPHLETIQIYTKGCNTPDADLLRSTIDPDIVHYFGVWEPIRGADALTNFVMTLNSGVGRTTWTMDHGIVEGDEAVVEFTAVTRFSDGQAPRIYHGTEWYKFRDAKISEVRAYSLGVSGKPIAELNGFPYAERGYTILGKQ